MPDQPEPSTVESGPVTLVSADVPGSTPMEQKKNLEESGLPTTDPSGDQPLPGADGGQTAGDEADFVSLEELQKMSYDDLKTFCASNQITVPPNVNEAQDLLDWLLVEFGVDA